MMFKKIRERNFHFLLLAFLTGLFIGIHFSSSARATEPAHRYLDYFHQVYQLVRTEYVDVPDTKGLFYGAIRGMLGALDDPFSRFLDERDYSDLKEMTTGKFVGVGVEITVRDGSIVVITPLDDSPAMRAGIMAGDIISKVDGKPIKDKSLSDIVKMIKGVPGSTVKMDIKREGHEELISFEVKRASIKIKSVEYTIIEKAGTGYLKIKNFGSDTSGDVSKALAFFNEKGIDRLIIDLRYNPGGLLSSSIEISDLFLGKDKVIVSTRGRKGNGDEKVYRSTGDPLYTGKLVLLVNRGSASASEILSGAIRDNRRGVLIGEKTFGKGSVQKSYNLDRDVGVAITIARYYTPSGELIHKKGIKPDKKVEPDRFSESDYKKMREIESRKLLDSFVKRGMVYNEETRKGFHEFLGKHKLQLSEKAEHFMLKRRLYRYRKRPLYDMEFDSQLSAAVEDLDRKNK